MSVIGKSNPALPEFLALASQTNYSVFARGQSVEPEII